MGHNHLNCIIVNKNQALILNFWLSVYDWKQMLCGATIVAPHVEADLVRHGAARRSCSCGGSTGMPVRRDADRDTCTCDVADRRRPRRLIILDCKHQSCVVTRAMAEASVARFGHRAPRIGGRTLDPCPPCVGAAACPARPGETISSKDFNFFCF